MSAADRIELADLLRQHGGAYLAAHALTRSQAKAWRAIVACRTQVLGGHVEQCAACGFTRHAYHSCRNRHCPKCQTRAKEQWIAQRQRDLLAVPYYHLVFTLPHALNPLAGRQLRAVTDLLFAAASDTLTAFGANPRWLGGRLAFSLVLHTWSQNLQRHLHVHALVAGSALADDGRWIASRCGFLFPVQALSKVFRAKFMTALTASRDSGRLRHDAALGDEAWRTLLAALWRHDWVVYAKQPLGGPAQVLDYLARYTHRVAVSNQRLVSLRQGQVALRVRDNAHAGKTRIERLPADAFIGRFLLHVLPPGFKRIRHYGLLASGRKKERLAACRAALAMPAPVPAVIETVDAFMRRVAQIDITRCPCCKQGRLQVIGVLAPRRMSFLGRHATGPPETACAAAAAAAWLARRPEGRSSVPAANRCGAAT